MNQELQAFWAYDQFPFTLSAAIVKFHDDGYIQAERYGSYCFKPICILPAASGKHLADSIKALGEEYHAAKKNLDEEYQKKLKKLLPFDHPTLKSIK